MGMVMSSRVGKGRHRTLELILLDLHPSGHAAPLEGFEGSGDACHLSRLLDQGRPSRPASRASTEWIVRRPLTLKWPWRTSWRASAREVAKPMPEHDVVEAPLEQDQQVLARPALHARSP